MVGFFWAVGSVRSYLILGLTTIRLSHSGCPYDVNLSDGLIDTARVVHIFAQTLDDLVNQDYLLQISKRPCPSIRQLRAELSHFQVRIEKAYILRLEIRCTHIHQQPDVSRGHYIFSVGHIRISDILINSHLTSHSAFALSSTHYSSLRFYMVTLNLSIISL
jgi:hypothetical protein